MTLLPLRPNVCMLVFNKDRKLLLGQRFGEADVWQFPQGGAEPEHSLEENVYRELQEELGIARALLKIEKKLNATHEYDFRSPPDYAKGKWRGQSQTFWLVRFTGNDSDIDLETHEQEFMGWKWCTVGEVRKFAEPKRLPGYEKVLPEVQAFLRQNS
jgi:putative (di)nucleoside polyphosphate hydrolase